MAIRALILRCVVSHSQGLPAPESLADAEKWWTPAERKDFVRGSKDERDQIWSTVKQYRKHISPTEKTFAQSTADTITSQQLKDATWRVEALSPILWCLGCVDRILPYDESTMPEFIGHFWEVDDKEFVQNAQLRSKEEIDVARDVAESWHWRSRTRQLQEDDTPFPDAPQFREAGWFSFDDIVRNCIPTHESEGTFVAIDEDFPAFGKAYRNLSAEEWSTVRSITIERHFALNWVCGYAPGHRWDETPTDT